VSGDERSSRRWLRWLLPVLTLALIGIFARTIDWRRAWSAIIQADPSLLAIATFANLASLVVKGIRWSLFLTPAGVTGIGQAVRGTLAGAALNNVLVANGGDAARVAAMARRGNVSSAAVLATLAVDRFCDLATYSALFVGAAFLIPLPPELARWRVPGFATLGALAGVTAVLVWRGSRRDSARDDDDAGPGALPRAKQYWRRLVATSAAIVTGPRMVIAIVLSFAAWAGQWATFQYAAHATAFDTTASESLVALLVVNASFLVRLTPGNVGVFQLLYALAATSAGLDKNSAVAVAFLVQLIQYVPVTVIGLLLAPSLVKGGTRATSSPVATLTGVQSDQTTRASGDIGGEP
jgi:uncharacterized membrane protein YbhN (UPF0104 family)